jgi:hypothetical protein
MGDGLSGANVSGTAGSARAWPAIAHAAVRQTTSGTAERG